MIDPDKFFVEDFRADHLVTDCDMSVGIITSYTCKEGHTHEKVKVFILNFNSIGVPPILVPCDSALGMLLLQGDLTEFARDLLDKIEGYGV